MFVKKKVQNEAETRQNRTKTAAEMRGFPSKLLQAPAKRLATALKKDAHPASPARTRFAPSPTGFLHLGSLRTALYNYLLARNTGGQFLLRLEDTDQKRLVPGAEQSLYESLEWCGLKWDEGPVVGGDYGPYRQSDRTHIYEQYIDRLLASGDAYRCFCSKERLDSLRESAKNLQPPTTVTYDRHCTHLTPEEAETKSKTEPYTIRFRAPARYQAFEDLLHGRLDLQPQVNKDDVRYDDQVLVKSDGLPTYHFANVIDDHLMRVSHVIRGEEWLPSTPKHIALYNAFGWEPPKFIHIPLLTSTKDKKLSKRSGDIDVRNFKEKGVLPETLVNFVALFGWAPKNAQNTDIYDLEELVDLFNLNDLTKGNAKVDDKKLWFFNKHYLAERIAKQDEKIVEQAHEILKTIDSNITLEKTIKLLQTVSHNLTTIHEIAQFQYLLKPVNFQNEHAQRFIDSVTDKSQLLESLSQFETIRSPSDIDHIVDELVNSGLKKRDVFQTLRFALSGSIPGLKIPLLIEFIGIEEALKRINVAIKYLKE